MNSEFKMKYELLKGWKSLLAIMIYLSSFNHSFMPCLPLSFVVFSLPCSPPMTSAPLGVLCPYLSCFSRPSHLHPICSLGSNLWSAEMAVYLLVLIKGSPLCDLCCWVIDPSRHCLSSVPALAPSQASLVIIMTTPFGVTHVFATSSNCPSYSWGFSHLRELQMKFLHLPSKSLMTPNLKKPTSLPMPAFNYTLLLPLMSSCLLV